MYDHIKRIAMLMISGSMIFVVTTALSIAEEVAVFEYRNNIPAVHLGIDETMVIEEKKNGKQYEICAGTAKNYSKRDCRTLLHIRLDNFGSQADLDAVKKRVEDTEKEVKKALKKTIKEWGLDLDEITTRYILRIRANNFEHEFLVWRVADPESGDPPLDGEPRLIIDGTLVYNDIPHDHETNDHGGAAHLR